MAAQPIPESAILAAVDVMRRHAAAQSGVEPQPLAAVPEPVQQRWCAHAEQVLRAGLAEIAPHLVGGTADQPTTSCVARM